MNTRVNAEIAKLLAERGFDEPCRFVHDTWNNIHDWVEDGEGEHRNSHKNASIYYSAPTIAEVVMWLYEKYGVWVHAEYMDVVFKFGSIICAIETNIIEREEWKFDSPTEAYEVAIKYALENLI